MTAIPTAELSPERQEIKQLQALAKNAAISGDIRTAGPIYARISYLREQIKTQNGATQ